jgi:hypothetical protein
MTPSASGLLHAILVPVWVFVAAILVFSIREIADKGPQPPPFLAVLASRAPPIA